MKLPIYFDYAATTPMDGRVLEKMKKYFTLDGVFGNPASRSHYYGWQAEESVDFARNQVATLIGADSREIIFTSGATESNNLAIKGVSEIFYKDKKKKCHIITSLTEHKSVLDTCQYLENQGVKITRLIPQKDGLISLKDLHNAFRDETILVSIMHVNNEIGVIQNIKEIGNLCHRYNILFHVDAAQSVGKLFINLAFLPVDLMSFSAHKIYGPKGIGCLYIRRNSAVVVRTQIHGGGHERGMRSGTLPVHQIIGMGEACHILLNEMMVETTRLRKLQNCLWKELRKIDGITLNGNLQYMIPTLLNISFSQFDGHSLIATLKDIAVSSGSACISSNLEPSYVLKALGLSDSLASSSIRISLGRFTTKEDIDYAIQHIKNAVASLREVNSLNLFI
ncbi:IscS subfamily cysteine desulfurase [Blochmannia endosymbiont of Colobopsis nipponica]|uniref:IscS subfamily cysteine desulfurase n=1 Tax=Blochmannia endosymbiont of Colobopsis nipponica TaxID=2681987 RepID=UPI0017812A4F|nr:IscS subfamily cysteine desulfurase [Blochmannia endosymbiont of Colobopsis nipponica]QOI10937.1 IscS subfamily cysteine desulfurase [Blochmannia endosymbiont of Colobopsis nipponica]